ncbi:hypothetical protein MNV49_002834 [Pseudohyphozyma bogoriensis]|nr:hypothetical protein MNV49_002834 [Pseudohyphozyma bogoriensis]
MSGRKLVQALGAVVCATVVGVEQERILKGTYGADQQSFTSSTLLILLSSIFTAGSAELLSSVHAATSSPGASAGAPKTSVAVSSVGLAGLFGFSSALFQLEALRRVEFTSVALAKASAVAPAIAAGALVHKLSTSRREWIAAGVIALGAATYAAGRFAKESAGPATGDLMSDYLGVFLLGFYLVCDAVFNNVRTRAFGDTPVVDNPFSSDYPILPHFTSLNLVIGGFSAFAFITSYLFGDGSQAVSLFLSEPGLRFDAFVLVVASSVAALLSISFMSQAGAPAFESLSIVQRFVGILTNATYFKNFGAIGHQGFLGVGWVASGSFIYMASPPPPKESGLLDKDYSEKHVSEEKPRPYSTYITIFLIPVVIVSSAKFFSFPDVALPASLSALTSGKFSGKYSTVGGRWGNELWDALDPVCPNNFTTVPYRGPMKTGFASSPRSGNSYMRTMIERATGYQTSSIYCDKSLLPTFLGECDKKATFFVKTHEPTQPRNKASKYWAHTYREFDQIVHVVRNPLDASASWWHLSNVPVNPDGTLDHEAKAKIGKFGKDQRQLLLTMARRWRDHTNYWTHSPISRIQIRYEDFRLAPVAKMMSLLEFLEPGKELPSLEKLACMIERTDGHEAYKSRKSPDFATWDKWEPELRREILAITRRPFCAMGYDKLLLERLGDDPSAREEMEGFCDLDPIDPARLFDNFGTKWNQDDPAPDAFQYD